METATGPVGANLLTLGFSENIHVDFGNISFGAAPARVDRAATGPGFRVCGSVVDCDGYYVYGLGRSDTGLPQVWRARTRDGIVFDDAGMLFECPAPESKWLAGDVALMGATLVLLQSQLGQPPEKGHGFHAFSGPLQGGKWKRLNDAPIYRGQDSFTLVWDEHRQHFINYQTAYQPWNKQIQDNMPNVRRVLHIRTSSDGVTWTPGTSFGVWGPHLPENQLIIPDEEDTPDTEFYHFSAVDFDEFRAGIMVKYVPQPPILSKCGKWPHGPFLGCEWWISRDGVSWQRPFRHDLSLDAALHAFAYSFCNPIIVGHELRWPTNAGLHVLNRQRMFYAYSRANAAVTTPLLTISGRPMSLEVRFESIRRKADLPYRQGYLMAELVDPLGNVLPGFERDKCVFMPEERTMLPLQWGGAIVPENLSGPVRLRLFFRDVRLFSLSY